MVHDLLSPPPSMVFTCAVDKTGAVWDCEVAQRIKKLKGHTSFVNSICPARRGLSLVVTGSDDGNIKVSACCHVREESCYGVM